VEALSVGVSIENSARGGIHDIAGLCSHQHGCHNLPTVLLSIPINELPCYYKGKIHRNPGYDIDFEHHYLNFEEIVYQEPLAIHVACPISANKLTG
jgi:hypothetical protein